MFLCAVVMRCECVHEEHLVDLCGCVSSYTFFPQMIYFIFLYIYIYG